MNLIESIFGTHSQRELKLINPQVDKILSLRDTMVAMSDEELKAQTGKFKERLAAGETLDDLLPEAFATVREAARRATGVKRADGTYEGGMEHYKVQLIGGIVLHQGRIAEMKTGEGKTLVSTAPAYLNALAGKGVLIVTVNDYLAARDAKWMGRIHRFLGLTVGVVLNSMDSEARKKAYACDITYVTNNELGFDYLRDNMAIYKDQQVLRNLDYCIIDEVDSVLIDEARTPLIISGQSGKSTKIYDACTTLANMLERGEASGEFTKMNAIMGEEITETGDYVVDEKDKVVNLTEEGVEKVEKFFGLENFSDPENLEIQHCVILALRAKELMHRDKDYVVKDGEVLIVDEFTGRIMPGRRFSDGLHQAIESKEHVNVRQESKTLATITFQNFFNKFKKKAGMTGTALTEEKEFRNTYGMDVIEIPTCLPIRRLDEPDAVYKTKEEKFKAVVEDIRETHEKGQPVLVGTITIETSEMLSKLLKREGIPHEVLNAKNHEREAAIIAQAGKKGAVTIATNMAGRGTDILLGGSLDAIRDDLIKALPKEEQEKYNPESEHYDEAAFAELDIRAREESHRLQEEIRGWKKPMGDNSQKTIQDKVEEANGLGGLRVIGTERHESRRIDNQLRGRSGRQGDPGSSCFYISLEDDLMRLFGSEHLIGMFNALGVPEGERIEHKMLTNAIEKAQMKIETNNYGIREQLLKYDEVNNDQREVIYAEREKVLTGENMRETILSMVSHVVERAVNRAIGEDTPAKDWDYQELNHLLLSVIPLEPVVYTEDKTGMTKKELLEQLKEQAIAFYEEKEKEFPTPDEMREVERVVLLRAIDAKWMNHIDDMEQLRQGIGLQAYGQRDPLVEYKMEAYNMFEEMIAGIEDDTVRLLCHLRIERKDALERSETPVITGTNKDSGLVKAPVVNEQKKIMPNDPCPCGSGKKFKQCCGRKLFKQNGEQGPAPVQL